MLPEFHARADIFVSPSIISSHGDMEGFGLVFVESMGSSCAVVVRNLPATPEPFFQTKYLCEVKH